MPAAPPALAIRIFTRRPRLGHPSLKIFGTERPRDLIHKTETVHDTLSTFSAFRSSHIN